MKIGIFGGSFNPPHKMHEEIAKKLVEDHYIEKVIFVPTGNCYPKKDLIDGKKRFSMLEILGNKNACFKVSDFELKEKLIYTYQTLEYFKKKYPSDQIYVILGADNLAQIKNWKNAQELLKNNCFLIIDRKNMSSQLKKEFREYQKQIQFVPLKTKHLSSTKIRHWLKENSKKAQGELDEDVFRYIKKNKIYE